MVGWTSVADSGTDANHLPTRARLGASVFLSHYAHGAGKTGSKRRASPVTRVAYVTYIEGVQAPRRGVSPPLGVASSAPSPVYPPAGVESGTRAAGFGRDRCQRREIIRPEPSWSHGRGRRVNSSSMRDPSNLRV